MFSKILVATDLTEASERVVRTLGGLSALGVREALLVHCFNIRDAGTLGSEIIELARPSFDRQKQALEEQGFHTEGMMILGLPHVEINRIALQSNCSLIVVGSQSRTMAGELLLGSTAGAVIHSASVPVLIQYLGTRREEGQVSGAEVECRPLEHVLFPTDFSDNAERAFSYVKQLAALGARRITLFHVQDRSRIDPHLADRLEEFNRIDTGRSNLLRPRQRDAARSFGLRHATAQRHACAHHLT